MLGLPGSTVSKRELPRGMLALRPGWNTEPHTERCVGEDGLVPGPWWSQQRTVSKCAAPAATPALARNAAPAAPPAVCAARRDRSRDVRVWPAHAPLFLSPTERPRRCWPVGPERSKSALRLPEPPNTACGRRARVGASAPATRRKKGAAWQARRRTLGRVVAVQAVRNDDGTRHGAVRRTSRRRSRPGSASEVSRRARGHRRKIALSANSRVIAQPLFAAGTAL